MRLLSLIGIILRWGFLIWELIFIYCRFFVLILVVFVLFFFFHNISAKFPIKDNYKIQYGPDYGRPDKENK